MKTTDVESRERTINIHAKAKRPQNVFAEPLDMSEDFVIPNFPKSDTAVKLIDASLADNADKVATETGTMAAKTIASIKFRANNLIFIMLSTKASFFS